jgi:hypothetical protein
MQNKITFNGKFRKLLAFQVLRNSKILKLSFIIRFKSIIFDTLHRFSGALKLNLYFI